VSSNGSFTDVTGAAARLRISYGRALRLILLGELTAVRINGKWYVDREALERLAEQRAGSPGGVAPQRAPDEAAGT